MTIRELRESIQTWLSDITELPDVVVLLERDDIDQEAAGEAALAAKGLLIVVQNAIGSFGAESQNGKLLKLDRAIPIALIENPVVNMGTGGTGVPGEVAVDILARLLMGRPGPFDALKVNGDSFGRIDEGDGVVTHFFVVSAPWLMRPSW